MLLILAFSSDLLRIRFPFIMLGFAFTFIGMIIYASINDVLAQIRVAYFATFMMCWGTSAPSVLLSTVSPHHPCPLGAGCMRYGLTVPFSGTTIT